MSEEYVQVVPRQDRCAVVKLLIWKRVRFWHENALIPEGALFVFPAPPWAVAVRCRARADASRDEVRPVVVLREECVCVCVHKHKPERHPYRRTGERKRCLLRQPERHHC